MPVIPFRASGSSEYTPGLPVGKLGNCRDWWVFQTDKPGSPPTWNDPANGLPSSANPNGASVGPLPSNLCTAYVSVTGINITIPGALKDWVAEIVQGNVTYRGEFSLRLLGQSVNSDYYLDESPRYGLIRYGYVYYSQAPRFASKTLAAPSLLTSENYYYIRQTLTLGESITSDDVALTSIKVDWGDGSAPETFTPTFLRQNPFQKFWSGAVRTHDYRVNGNYTLKTTLVDAWGRETEYRDQIAVTSCESIKRRLAGCCDATGRIFATNNIGQLNVSSLGPDSLDEIQVETTIHAGLGSLTTSLWKDNRNILWAVIMPNGIGAHNLYYSENDGRSFSFPMIIWDSVGFTINWLYTHVQPDAAGGFLAVGVKAIGTIPDQTFEVWFKRGTRSTPTSFAITWSEPILVATPTRQEPWQAFQLWPSGQSTLILTNGYSRFFYSEDWGRTWIEVLDD